MCVSKDSKISLSVFVELELSVAVAFSNKLDRVTTIIRMTSSLTMSEFVILSFLENDSFDYIR